MSMQYIQPTEEQIAEMQIYRDKYQALLKDLNKLSGSRGVSLAITNLEQSAMWLNKALTKND